MQINNIKLNFLDSYYSFYEWLDSDKIINYSNVEITKVNTKIMNDLINNKIMLDVVTNNIVIYTDCFSFLAIEYDAQGKSLFKSSILLEDEERIMKKAIKKTSIDIKYHIIEKDQIINTTRKNEHIKNVIKTELDFLSHNYNSEKVEYLYYEWFKKKEKNEAKMLKNMYKKIDLSIGKSEKEIYELIKVSNKNV